MEEERKRRMDRERLNLWSERQSTVNDIGEAQKSILSRMIANLEEREKKKKEVEREKKPNLVLTKAGQKLWQGLGLSP